MFTQRDEEEASLLREGGVRVTDVLNWQHEEEEEKNEDGESEEENHKIKSMWR